MRFSTLAEWLAWQESLHPSAIELGLDRVREVLGQLGHCRPPFAPPFTVVTVAGTNGKGSTVAFLEAMLRAAGQRVGAYTSPHLLHYNERIRVDGREIEDAALCDAFARVDRARGDTSLTYFEFGTLAAIDHFVTSGVAVALLEVGLGGRLDAVNVVDPDVAVIASVDLDHRDWLGDDRETVGREKAGILRPGRPAVLSDPAPPESILRHARELGAPLYRLGAEFGFTAEGVGEGDGWAWRGPDHSLSGLPRPALAGPFQLRNAAGAVMAASLLPPALKVDEAAIRRGLAEARVAGRFQVIPGAVETILDVGHNPDAARALAEALAERPCRGRTLAVCAMLGDKDAAGVAAALAARIDRWFLAGLAAPRGLTGAELARRMALAAAHEVHGEVAQALAAARAAARPGDRVVIFGSFHTVAAAAAECV